MYLSQVLLYFCAMRYFAELSYKGTNYSGWQRQPNASSIQQTIEEALATFLRIPTPIVGCGRTDAGVHAKQYFCHFDTDKELEDHFVFRLNKYLPKDIAIHQIFKVKDDVHARFDATHRAYEYHIHTQKSPFIRQTSWFYPQGKELDFAFLQEAAHLLLKYHSFFPFCKTNSDVKTMRCQLFRSEWEQKGDQLIFHIAANRFLRGMVRLIVGMCINVARHNIKLEDVYEALDQQTRLKMSYSVPPEGLYLTDIRYEALI